MNYECYVKFKDGAYRFSYTMSDGICTESDMGFVDDIIEFDCIIVTDEDSKEITLTTADLAVCSHMANDINNLDDITTPAEEPSAEDIESVTDYIKLLPGDLVANTDITRMLILSHTAFNKIGRIKDVFVKDIMDILSKDIVNVLRVADYLCMNEIVNKLLAMKLPIEGMDFTILNHNLKYWDVIDNWSRGYRLYCTKVIHEIIDADVFKEATRRGMPVEEIRRELSAKTIEDKRRNQYVAEKTSLNITDDTIQYCHGLKILDVSGNLKITSLEPFADTLEELYHGGYYPDNILGDTGINQDQIMRCYNLRFIRLLHITWIGDLPPSLISLDLRGNCITYEQLMGCANLKELKISHNSKIRKIPPTITKLILGSSTWLGSNYQSEVMPEEYDESDSRNRSILLRKGHTSRRIKVNIHNAYKYTVANLDNIEYLEILDDKYIIPITGIVLKTLVLDLDETCDNILSFAESPNIENLTISGRNASGIFRMNINWLSVQNLKIEGDDAYIAENIKDSGIKILEIISTHKRKGFFDNNNNRDRKDYFYFDEPEYNTIFNKRKHVNFDSFKYLETLITYGCVELTKDTCIKHLTCRAVSGERPSGIRIFLWDSVGNKVQFNGDPFEGTSEYA